jgi:hypothetical protein
MNFGCHCGMPATNCLSYGTALTNYFALSGRILKIRKAVDIKHCLVLANSKFEMHWRNVYLWSEFLATDPEVRVRFPALPDFLRSSGSGTRTTQPREYN